MTMQNPHIGQWVGSYQLIEVIGRGGMGDVYLAKHPQIGKQVAIKILKPELCGQEEAVQRFFHEAKAVNNIHHPNIVDIIDFGKTPEGLYYILMEYLEGETLQDFLRAEGVLPLEQIGHIGLQLCSALEATHQKGIIHRDLKAENIILITHQDQDDFVKVLDFGIAKILDAPEKPDSVVGVTLGTPLYMSPEHAMGLPVDAQSDIYALGVLLYQMSTGTYPFFDQNPFIIPALHINAPLPWPREKNPKISAALEEVIVRCLQKRKEARYFSMAELAIALGMACGVDPLPYFNRRTREALRPLLETELLKSQRSFPALKSAKTGPQSLADSYPELFAVSTPLTPAEPLPPVPETEPAQKSYAKLLAAGAFLFLGVLAYFASTVSSGRGHIATQPAQSVTQPASASSPASQALHHPKK